MYSMSTKYTHVIPVIELQNTLTRRYYFKEDEDQLFNTTRKEILKEYNNIYTNYKQKIEKENSIKSNVEVQTHPPKSNVTAPIFKPSIEKWKSYIKWDNVILEKKIIPYFGIFHIYFL